MKKFIFITIFLIAGNWCSGQINTFVDTVFYNDGRIYVCKITGETSDNIQFKTKDSTTILDWNVGKYKLKRYVDIDAFTNNVYESKTFIEKKDSVINLVPSNKKVELTSMQDTIIFLFNENASMQKQLSQSAVNFGNIYNNVYSAGKNLKTTGTISIVGIGFGVIGGFCFLMSSYYAKPTANATRSYEHDVQSWATLGAVACGISGACMISIPIGIFSAGKKLKAIK